MNTLRYYLHKQAFNPGLLGAFLNPFFLARRSLWNAISDASPSLSGSLLDIGCGTKPYRSLFKTPVYIGLEVDSDLARLQGLADVFYDGDRLPFPVGKFNAVLCNQVLEHVFSPAQFLSEIRRVLVPGGAMILTVPFVWDEHEQPNDYARYSTFGLRFLLEQNGFRVIRQKKLLADASIIMQIINVYLFKITVSKSKYLNLFVTAALLGPLSLLGLLMGLFLPKSQDLFLDQLVVAEAI